MSIEENKALIHRFYEEFVNPGNLSVAEELFAPDCVLHFAGLPEPMRGPEGFKQTLRMLRTGFPDAHWSIEEIIAEGDAVAERVSGHGTHQGEFFGIAPTGKQVTIRGVAMIRIVDGKIAEFWGMPDMVLLLQQLGAIPTPVGQTSG